MNTRKPVAIVLHGPPASGKSETSKAIQSRFPNETVRLINLDHYWWPNEVRYAGGKNRYADIRNATERIIILELACGEPPDLAFFGATRAANEWLSVLQETGRAVFTFRLFPNWTDAADRLLNRVKKLVADGELPQEQLLFSFWRFAGLYALYDNSHPLTTIPASFNEIRIGTSGRTEADVANEILRIAELA